MAARRTATALAAAAILALGTWAFAAAAASGSLTRLVHVSLAALGLLAVAFAAWGISSAVLSSGTFMPDWSDDLRTVLDADQARISRDNTARYRRLLPGR